MAKKRSNFNENIMDMIDDIDVGNKGARENFRQDLLKLLKKYPSIVGPFSKNNGVMLLVDILVSLITGIVNSYETLDRKKTKEIDKLPTWIDD